jgi:hypothetical protein
MDIARLIGKQQFPLAAVDGAKFKAHGLLPRAWMNRAIVAV